MKEFWQRFCITNNVIHVDLSPSLHVAQDIVNFVSNVGYGIDVAHYEDLTSFLATVSDHGKHKVIIWVEKLLIEKWNGIKYNYVCAALDVSNYLWLKWKQIRVKKHHIYQLPDINNSIAFFLILGIDFSNNKNGEAKRHEIGYKLQFAVVMHLIKSFVNKTSRIVIPRINF